jgi:hypothetical protein
MAFIQDLANNLINVDTYIAKYEAALKESEDYFILSGRKLEEVCKQTPKNTVKMKRIFGELKSMAD